MRIINQPTIKPAAESISAAGNRARSASPFKGTLLFLVMASVGVFARPDFVSGQVASQEPPARLMEYFAEALENSPALAVYQTRIEAGNQRERQAGSLPDPVINLGYFLNPDMETQVLGRFSVSAMQMFPWFGSLGAARDERRFLTDAEKQQYKNSALDLFRDLHLAWLDIAEIQTEAELTRKEIDLLDNLKSQIQTRFETGRASQVDLLYVELEQERLAVRIKNLESRLPALNVRFNSLMGREGDAEVKNSGFAGRELVADRAGIAELANRRSPEIMSLEAGYASLESGIDRNRRMGMPEFGLGLEVMGRDYGSMTMMNMNEGYFAMATVRLPLWRGKYDGRRDEYRALQRGLQLEIDSERLQIEQNVSRLINSYEEAGREITLVEERIIPRIERMYRLVLESYASGSADFNELISLRRELLAQQIAHAGLRFEQERALSEIEREAAEHIRLVD